LWHAFRSGRCATLFWSLSFRRVFDVSMWVPQPFIRSRVVSPRSLVQSLPEIDLDAYRVCVPPKFRPGELTFTSISIVFGTLLPTDLRDNCTLGVLMRFMSRTHLRCGVVDLFVFLIIFFTARGPQSSRFPGIPRILDAILRDATVHFLLIVASQLVLFFFVFLAPVCDPYHHPMLVDPVILIARVFSHKIGSCPGCRFSPRLNQK